MQKGICSDEDYGIRGYSLLTVFFAQAVRKMKRDTSAQIEEGISARVMKRSRTTKTTSPSQKKAQKIVIANPGGYDMLSVQETEMPVPQEGEALVEVVAIGVNYADVCVRLGVYESAKKVLNCLELSCANLYWTSSNIAVDTRLL